MPVMKIIFNHLSMRQANKLLLLKIICHFAIFALYPAIALGASFDCTKASSHTEIEICSDPELSKLDDDLGILYRRAKAVATDKAAFKKKNTLAWNYRETTCKDRSCLLDWYSKRSKELQLIIDGRNSGSIQVQAIPKTVASTNQTVPQAVMSKGQSGDGSVWGWLAVVASGLLWFRNRVKKKPASANGLASATSASRTNNLVLVERTMLRPASDRVSDSASKMQPIAASAASINSQEPRWIRPGEAARIVDVAISEGMVFVGPANVPASYNRDPGVIDPSLKVSKYAVNTHDALGYYPNYSQINPDQRRIYLNWLAGGRQDPQVEIGYVFLFFYGIERRVLLDIKANPNLRTEIPALRNELLRLLGIYNANSSFRRYATCLIDFMDLLNYASISDVLLPPEPPDSLDHLQEVQLKIVIGQYALAGIPLPVSWAVAWVQKGLGIMLSSGSRRNPALFGRALRAEIERAYPSGISLRANKTKISCSYSAASAALFGSHEIRVPVPDVTALLSPTRELQALATVAEATLAKYTRSVGTRKEKADSLESLVHLPVWLWPLNRLRQIEAMRTFIGADQRLTSFGELLQIFKLSAPVARKSQLALQAAIESQGFAVEPPLGVGATALSAEYPIVLFAITPQEISSLDSPAAQTEAIMLELATSVALADGSVSAAEMRLLLRQIESAIGLNPAQRARLRARLHRSIAHPSLVRLSANKIQLLDEPLRRAVGRLLVAIAQVDGDASADEIKVVEKTYKALGLDKAAVYADLHHAVASVLRPMPLSSAQSSSTLVLPVAAGLSGLELDIDRIAAIQAETATVTALLADVFSDTADETSPEDSVPNEGEVDDAVVATDVAPVAEVPALLGLDVDHSDLLRLLLSRPSWSRADLEDVAADRAMMLDGALERINEAAFDYFNEALLEGEDPVEVRQNLLEAQSS